MWTSKFGSDGAHLRLGLSDRDGLVTFGDLTTPTLVMRQRNATNSDAITRTVVAYADAENEPDLYNAEVVFSDFTGITPGVYVCEVNATQNGESVSFPQAGYFLIRFRAGVD